MEKTKYMYLIFVLAIIAVFSSSTTVSALNFDYIQIEGNLFGGNHTWEDVLDDFPQLGTEPFSSIDEETIISPTEVDLEFKDNEDPLPEGWDDYDGLKIVKYGNITTVILGQSPSLEELMALPLAVNGISAYQIPEPSVVILLGVSLLLMVILQRKKNVRYS
jgi:hypothetical protein